MARYVGFRGLRIGDLDWEKIEPEKGKFQWKDIDSKIALAEQYGFRQEDMLFTLIGVPRWASSRPDSNRLLLGSLKEYRTVVPKDLNDWADYLRALIRHFPKVRTYELWNEPHFPGYSIFWSDTPENHVRLMEAGYRAIKGENPAIRVWWAGISKRYMTFYKEFSNSAADNSSTFSPSTAPGRVIPPFPLWRRRPVCPRSRKRTPSGTRI